MITAAKLLAQVRAKDQEAIENGFCSARTEEIQKAIAECPEIKPMLRVAEFVPTAALLGFGIELGYAIAQAEMMDKEFGG